MNTLVARVATVWLPFRVPQVTLKNYDPQRDKRFSGTFKLPTIPR